MKTRTYKIGTKTCKSTFKTAGHGYEVCFVWGGKTVFVGNFVHKTEAMHWYALMNREVRTFGRKFKGTTQLGASQWYQHFFSSHLHKTYYSFLDRVFSKHTRTFTKAFNKDLRKYKQWKSRTPKTAIAARFVREAA